MKRIAYSKIGRSIFLDPGKFQPGGNGDQEPLFMLLDLAKRHPDVTWVIAGRYTLGANRDQLPANIEIPEWPIVEPSAKWAAGAAHATPEDMEETMQAYLDVYSSCDGALVHIGQHGTSNQPIPQDSKPDILTNPQEWSVLYAGPTINALNVLGDEGFQPVWLVQDPRNYLKARDVKWYPLEPVLGQFDMVRKQGHYRFGDSRSPDECGYEKVSEWKDSRSWTTIHAYQYSGLELAGVPRWEDLSWPDWEDRGHFGCLMNENRTYVNHNRLDAIRQWVLPFNPSYVHGKWSKKSIEQLGLEITPIPYDSVPDVLSSTRSMVTTPASGSGWATAKPWEAFAVGTVCFFHPRYDTQGHIVPTVQQCKEGLVEDEELKYLAWWLRPENPEQLGERIIATWESRETYEWLRDAQRRHLERARSRNLIHQLIDSRLGLT